MTVENATTAVDCFGQVDMRSRVADDGLYAAFDLSGD